MTFSLFIKSFSQITKSFRILCAYGVQCALYMPTNGTSLFLHRTVEDDCAYNVCVKIPDTSLLSSTAVDNVVICNNNEFVSCLFVPSIGSCLNARLNIQTN